MPVRFLSLGLLIGSWLLFPTLTHADGVIQAKLAYMDLLAGNIKSAYQRIPIPSQMAAAEATDADISQNHPTLAFARQMRLYGQNKLAIEALEHYTEAQQSQALSNRYWLEFGEYFLDSGSIASAEYCFNIIREPFDKPIRSRYYRLKSEVLLHKLQTDEVEYILKKKWKGRDPEKPYTRFNLASVYLEKGDYAKADEALQQLKKDFPKKHDPTEIATLLDSANLRIGFSHLTSGNLDLAKAFLTRIPVESQYAPRAALGLAWVDLGKAEYATALSPLAHLIETEPNYSQEKQEAYSLLPVVASQQKFYGKAANLYKKSHQLYIAERDAVKRRSIPIYSGKVINQLTANLTNNDDNQFDIQAVQEALGKPLYSYLFKLLEKDQTKALFNAYYQQVLLLQDLNTWHQNGLLKADAFQRLSQLLKNSIFKHKDRLIRTLAAEVESHITRLEKMASHAEFSAGQMYDRVSSNQN